MEDIRVLLIDDDPGVRKALARYLEFVAEFLVTQYDNGSEALEHLQGTNIDYTAVLLDYVLTSEMGGEQVLAELQKKYPKLPVIIFTGKAPKGGASTLAKGAYRYMRRPIDYTDLEATIKSLAEQDRALRRMAQDVRSMLDSDICLAWRLNRQEKQFRVVAWDGEELDEWYRQNVFLNLEDLATREFFSKGAPLFLPNIAASKRYKRKDLANERNWTSLISIPLIKDNHVVGLIDSYTHKELGFKNPTEEEHWLKTILPAFARQATEAVRNAELSERFQILQNINQILAGTFDEERAIKLILGKGLELVGTDLGWIYLIDRDAGKLVLRNSSGIPDNLVAKEREVGAGITGWVAQEGQALNVVDVNAPPKGVSHISIPGIEVASEIAVPLRREEQIIGVLTAKSPHKGAFTNDDLELLIALASQAALVIGQASLTKHLQRISELTLEGDFNELAKYVVKAVSDLTGAEVILWMMRECEKDQDAHEEKDQSDCLRVIASEGNFDDTYKETARVPLGSGKSITAEALASGKPIIRENILDDPNELKFHNIGEAMNRGWHSFMTVPMLGEKDKPLGSLSLYSKDIGKFGPQEAELIGSFANQAASAFAQLQQRQALEQLALSGQLTIEQELGETSLLQQFAEQARALTKAPCAVIYPYDPEQKRFFDTERIVTSGLISPKKKGVAKRPREMGLAAIVRDTGEIVVHDLEAGDIDVDLRKTDEVSDEAQLLTFIREEDFIKRENIQAFFGISLQATGYDKEGESQEEVGVLYINYRTPHRFTPTEIELIHLFAQQVANVIRATRLWTQTQDQLNLNSILIEASRAIEEAYTQDSVLSAVFEYAFELVGDETGLVIAVDPIGELRIVTSKGISQKAIKTFNNRPADAEKGSFAQVIQSGKIFKSSDTDKDLGSGRMADLGLPIPKQVTNIPLKSEEDVVGILVLDTFVSNSQIEDALIALADTAGIALERAQSYEYNRRQLDALRSIIEMIDHEDPLPFILYHTAELFRANWGSFALVNPSNQTLTFHAIWDQDHVLSGEEIPEDQKERKWEKGITGHVARTGACYRIGNVKGDPYYEPWYASTVSEMAVPLKSASGETIGVLNLESSRENAFTPLEEHLCEKLAQVTAITVEKAELYRQIKEQRAQQIEAIEKIAEAITADVPKQEVLDRILGWTTILLGEVALSEVKLLEGDKLVVEAIEPKAEVADIPVGKGVTGWVAENKEHLNIGDVSKDKGRYIPFLEGIRSELAVPMFKGEELIGVLNIEHTKLNAFDDNDVALAQAIANLAAVAIDNAMQRDQLVQAISKISELIVTTLPYEETLDAILHWAISLLRKASLGEIRLLDKESDELVVEASVGQVINEEYRRMPVGKGITGWVAEHKQALLVPDVNEDIRYLAFLEGTGSEIAAPMMAEEELIGVLNIEHPVVDALNQSDLELAKAVANLTAVAINNARLYKKLDRQVKELTALREIGRTLSTQDIDKILEEIHTQAEKLLEKDAENLYIAFYDEDDNEISFPLAYDRGKKIETGVGVWSPRQPGRPRYGLTEYIIGQKGPVVSAGDMREWAKSREIEISADIPTKSWIGVPLKAWDPEKQAEKVIGVISIQSHRTENAFTQDDVRILSTIADQAAVAIQNARLYRELDRRVKELEALSAIGHTLSTENVNEILEEIHTQAENLLREEAQNLYIAFYDEQKDEVSFPLAYSGGEKVETGSEVWSSRQMAKPLEEGEIRNLGEPRYGLTEYIVDTGKAEVSVGNMHGWARERRIELADDIPTQSWIGVPLKVRAPEKKGEKVIGVISIQSHRTENAYNFDDLRVLETIASQAAVAIENARLYKQLEDKVSDLKKAQIKIAETEAVLARAMIAADFVHRLNNLAGTIPFWIERTRSYLGNILEKDDKIEYYLGQAEENAKNVLRAAEQLKSPPKTELVNLNSTLDSLVRESRIQTLAGIEIEMECEDNLPAVRAIESELIDAIANIINNGIDAMEDEGTLSIRAHSIEISDCEKWIEIRISDEGGGIPESELDKIFSPFYSTKEGHTGYGLWRSRNIINKLGGTIELDVTPDVGITFVLKLPGLVNKTKRE